MTTTLTKVGDAAPEAAASGGAAGPKTRRGKDKPEVRALVSV